MCCGRLGKSLKTGGRDVVAGHEALGEILGGFKLRGFLGRAKNLQATGAENIDHAGCQRRFRADDGEVDLVLLGEISQGFRIGDVDVFQLVLARRAGIAGGDVNFLQPSADARGVSRPPEPPGARPWRARGRRNR
jgi:hypothetical protein